MTRPYYDRKRRLLTPADISEQQRITKSLRRFGWSLFVIAIVMFFLLFCNRGPSRTSLNVLTPTQADTIAYLDKEWGRNPYKWRIDAATGEVVECVKGRWVPVKRESYRLLNLKSSKLRI